MTLSDIKKMFTKHLIDSHKVNYKDFIFDIRSFKFKPLNIYVDSLIKIKFKRKNMTKIKNEGKKN